MAKDPRFDPRFSRDTISSTAEDRTDNKIVGKEIANNSILTNHLANGAVTSEKTALSDLSIGQKKVLSTTGNNTITSMNPLWSLFRPNGAKLYYDEQFEVGNNGISVYNNAGGTAVTHTRKNTGFIDSTAAQPPNSSGYVIEIRHAPTESSGTAPGYGGWYFATATSSGKRMVCVFRMKIPAGRVINFHSNSIGTNGDSGWLTSNLGTGLYEDYAYYVNSGTTSYSSTFFFAVAEGSNATFYTYLASATVYELSNHESITSSKFYADDWFRSYGSSGWYNETYGGGIFMEDSNYVKVYNNKAFMPSSGSGTNGIIFPLDPGGGGGDAAYIKYYPYSGEACRLDIIVENDANDYIRIATPSGTIAISNRLTLSSCGSRGTTGYAITTPNDSVANALRASGYIEWQTDVGAIGTTYFLSDIRKKDNIVPSNINTLDIIKQFNFISFDWKPESGMTGHVKVGMSAQQLQSIEPDLVRELSDGTLMIHEPSIIPYLTKAVQEQNDIIEKQQKLIEDLEARLKTIEDLLK